jgi:hypothetical protein
MIMKRVTADDLEWAAGWLEAYEDDQGVPAERSTSDDEFVQIAQRVAAYLRIEAGRRHDAAIVRNLVRSTGASPARVREALAKRMLTERN